MPWASKAQRAWAHATDQPWADKWDAHTPKGAKLPAHVRSGEGGQGTQGRKPKGAGGGQWAGYVASPLHRDRSTPQP